MRFRFDIDPVPASRPRVSRYGTYYGPTYRLFKSKFAALLTELAVAASSFKDKKLDVSIKCVVSRPAKTVLDAPRGDVDNYAKGVLDGLNGILWDDDTQVLKLTVSKEFSKSGEDGYIVLDIKEHKR